MGETKVIIELEDDVYRRVKNNPQIFKNATCVAVQNGISLDDFLDKAYDELDNCDCGSSYIVIDGKMYFTDMGYAFEGIKLFINYLKKRWGENEN